MKELHAILRSLAASTPSAQPSHALATLVKVEGSSYRRAGARLLWQPEGARLGSISGGCLEEDVISHCRTVLAEGRARTVVYDTTDENDLVWGVGLGCNGIVRLLIEPVRGLPEPLAAIARAGEQRRGSVLAHVYAARDAAHLGLALALGAGGPETPDWVRVPQPAWEPALVAAARAALADRKSSHHAFADLPGQPEVFFEYVPPPLRLLIFGAGDDAQPLSRMAHELGWTVSVHDPRPAYAQASRFPEAREVVLLPPADVGRVTIDDRTVAVIMTHHYLHDLPLLRGLLPRGLRYLGLLGPKKRAEKLLADLRREGLSFGPEELETLHAPVGLDLGGTGPESVALAILAEIQAVLAQRDGRALRLRDQPIHG